MAIYDTNIFEVKCIIGNQFYIKIDLKNLSLEEKLVEDIDIHEDNINEIKCSSNNYYILVYYNYVDLQYFNDKIKNKIYKRALEFINKCIKEKENEINILTKTKKENPFNDIIMKQKLNKINNEYRNNI